MTVLLVEPDDLRDIAAAYLPRQRYAEATPAPNVSTEQVGISVIETGLPGAAASYRLGG